MIQIGDEGPLLTDLKDGDIWQVYGDNWTPGTEELKQWLIIQTEDYRYDMTELTRVEYTIGLSLEMPQVKHAREYYVRYWEKFTPTELLQIRDKTQSFPVVSGKFTLWDIIPKP